MYTTPRKVKQESRLRRSLSLTNNMNRSNSSATELDLNGTAAVGTTVSPSINYSNQQDGVFIENHQPHFFLLDSEPREEEGETTARNSSQNLYQQYPLNGLRVLPPPPQLSASTAQFHPPPYREPPALGKNSGPLPSFDDLPNLVPDYSTYQTHSSKFPIVREVVFSKESSGSEPHHPKIPTLSQYHKIQNRKLTTKQIAWTDERKAFTLDSRTAKDFQERLLFSPPNLTRRNSLDLEKFLKVFNEDQATLMASMQGGRLNNMDGVDNPTLDLGPIPHNHSHSQSNSGLYPSSSSNKMSGYFPDSSNSQSLSLSSSTADSMDTVIYKGPGQPSPSIRDWQRSIDPNLERSVDFNHRGENNNSYRESSVFVDSRTYQMQQASSYHPLQFNGPGGQNGNGSGGGMNGHGSNFSIEYHRGSAQQAQQNQMLSVQSIPHSISNNSSSNGPNNHSSSPHNHHTPNGNVSNNNNGMSNNMNVLRAGNNSITSSGSGNNNNNSSSNSAGNAITPNGGTPNGIALSKSYGSNPQLSSKSPLLTQKQFSPVPISSSSSTTTPTNSSNTAADLNHLLESKTGAVKDSSKLFHTKTYNHIKDMISSRFGAASANHNGNNTNSPKAVNNSEIIRNGGVSLQNGPLNNNPSNNNNNSNNNNSGVTNPNSGNSNNGMINSHVESGGYSPSQQNYGLQQQQHHQHLSALQQSIGAYSTPNGTAGGAPYYASPPTQSPPSYPIGMVNGTGPSPHHQHHPHGLMNGSGSAPPNSYRSPPMNDRKNVNTSFRKAIQKSTQKSNLAEDSVPQMRPIMEATGLPIGNSPITQASREMFRSSVQYNNNNNNNNSSDQMIHHQHQQINNPGPGTVLHAESRAQRALDKLVENGALPGQLVDQFRRTGSGPMVHPHSHQQQLQQQQPQTNYTNNGGNNNNNNNNSGRLQNTQYSSGNAVAAPDARSPGLSQPSLLSQQQNADNLHARHKFNTKAGLGSPTSGLTVVESAHHATVAYSKSQGITNEAFQGNDEYNEPPPPLPTSQHPGAAQQQHQHQQQKQQQQQQDMNTVGLPVLAEKRENGDGSSGSTETTKSLGDPSLRSSEQLKQITAELQNLAMSVSAEHQSSSSECEKGSQRVGSGQSHTTTDSGHGTVLLAKSPLHSSDPSEPMDGLIGGQRQKFNENIADSISSGNDSEWVDIVEPEIRQILEMERAGKPPTGKPGVRNPNTPGNNQGVSTHLASRAPGGQLNPSQTVHQSYNPASRLHQGAMEQAHNGGLEDRPPPSKKSPVLSPKLPKYDLNSYAKKAGDAMPGTSQQAIAALAAAKAKSPRLPTKVHRSNSNSGSARLNAWSSRQRLANDKGKSSSRKELSQSKGGKLSRTAMSQILYSLQDDNGDITSTTTGLDLESMLDGPTENTSDDDDLSTTIDTTDAHAIRRQLESLESMYTEVLKVLGGRKINGRYPSSDLRNSKRRPYGSMSSLPSSVSSRPFREKKKVDDKKKVKDLKSINRRFQRLESHVVTLARSVAHLSSEMRTQHLMVQEMESIRNEMTQLRNQVVKAQMQSHAAANAANGGFARVASGRNGAMPNVNVTDWSSFRNALPSLTNPTRVRKLTKFFGDEPPLIRIFLKKLGYEKYASVFEQERIGIMELPYLTEDRLNKMGIPMGPRLRILQEAHMCLKPHHHGDGNHQTHHHTAGNLSVYVV